MAEWAGDTDPDTRAAAGLVGPVPSESTLRRVLQRLAADRFDALLGGWAAQRTRPRAGRRRQLAVDGKTLRGLGAGQTRPGTCWPRSTTTTVSCSPRSLSPPAPARRPSYILLDSLDLTVITADAAHPQRATASYLHARSAHYLLTVTRNQPTLFAQLTALP